jgi:hypothetical protein
MAGRPGPAQIENKIKIYFINFYFVSFCRSSDWLRNCGLTHQARS